MSYLVHFTIYLFVTLDHYKKDHGKFPKGFQRMTFHSAHAVNFKLFLTKINPIHYRCPNHPTRQHRHCHHYRQPSLFYHFA